MNLTYASVGHFLADEQSKQSRKMTPDQEDPPVYIRCVNAGMLTGLLD
jgi:hypothetical protein